MESTFQEISWTGLLWSAGLVALVVLISMLLHLNLERRLLIGCVRTVVQLLAMGYVLGWIITSSAASPLIVVCAAVFQLAMACWTIKGLLNYRIRNWWWIGLAGVLPAYLVVMSVLLLAVINPKPLWDARVVLTLGGMLLGNTITGIALAVNRFQSDLQANREIVLAKLALGSTWKNAVLDERSAAAQAALLPTVAALYTVGLVSLPGMMTGQIIAGADPVDAVKYQIIVMFMIAAAVALGTSLSLMLVTRCGKFPVPLR